MRYKAITFFLSLWLVLNAGEFESPSKREIEQVGLERIKYHLKGKGVGLDYRELFDKAIAEEARGFIGYHGASVDYLIYQDIIRITVEEVWGVAVRKDFHYLAVPFKREELDFSKIVVKGTHYSEAILEGTFPLNISLYANHCRFGLNSVVNFTKNRGERQKSELKRWYRELGLDPAVIDEIYEMAREYLESKSGVLLQLFDSSESPYAFLNGAAYPSYPNGFPRDNRLASECMEGDFPHELRLILSREGALDPNSPLVVKRYTKIPPAKLKAWEQKLSAVISSCKKNV